MRVLGVDACKRGWVGVLLRSDGSTSAVLDSTLDGLTDQLGGTPDDPEIVAVDIPIGLVADGHREADLAAREVLGPRRSSVFLTPVREALLAETHAEASAISVRLTGRGISQQAYALREKILDAEGFAARSAPPLFEVHPELSFAMLLGQPAAWAKKSWAGLRERMAALEGAGVALGDFGSVGGRAGPDDVLDAAAAAWTARRLQAGTARSFPPRPPRDPLTGREIAIWA